MAKTFDPIDPPRVFVTGTRVDKDGTETSVTDYELTDRGETVTPRKSFRVPEIPSFRGPITIKMTTPLALKDYSSQPDVDNKLVSGRTKVGRLNTGVGNLNATEVDAKKGEIRYSLNNELAFQTDDRIYRRPFEFDANDDQKGGTVVLRARIKFNSEYSESVDTRFRIV